MEEDDVLLHGGFIATKKLFPLIIEQDCTTVTRGKSRSSDSPIDPHISNLTAPAVLPLCLNR